MELTRLHPRVIWLWRIQGLTRVFLFWGPVCAGLWFWLSKGENGALGVVCASAIFAFQFLLALVWPGLTWRFFGYAIREGDLLVKRGVLFRRCSSIPHSRIQHVDTRQGPLDQLFGLSRVLVFTASGMAADGSLPGVEQSVADAIRDDLSRRGGDDGV